MYPVWLVWNRRLREFDNVRWLVDWCLQLRNGLSSGLCFFYIVFMKFLQYSWLGESAFEPFCLKAENVL